MKILTKEDEKKRIVMQAQHLNDVKDESTDLVKRDDLGRFNTYFRQIILYNSTPKVNLAG